MIFSTITFHFSWTAQVINFFFRVWDDERQQRNISTSLCKRQVLPQNEFLKAMSGSSDEILHEILLWFIPWEILVSMLCSLSLHVAPLSLIRIFFVLQLNGFSALSQFLPSLLSHFVVIRDLFCRLIHFPEQRSLSVWKQKWFIYLLFLMLICISVIFIKKA